MLRRFGRFISRLRESDMLQEDPELLGAAGRAEAAPGRAENAHRRAVGLARGKPAPSCRTDRLPPACAPACGAAPTTHCRALHPRDR